MVSENGVRAAFTGAVCGLAACVLVALSVNLDTHLYLVLGALPGAILLPAAWGWSLRRERSSWMYLLGFVLPFVNVPLTGTFAWALGLVFGPRGGAVATLGGLTGVWLAFPMLAGALSWFLLPVGALTTIAVRIAIGRRT